jgi:hypothetical protein
MTSFHTGSRTVSVALLLAASLAAQVCPPTWNEGTFQTAGPNGRVNAAKWFNDGSGLALYLGGAFGTAGAATSPNFVRWRGGQFEPLAGGVGGDVLCVEVLDVGNGPELFVGGNFTSAGGAAASNVARWTGSGFAPLGGGVGGPVRALAAADLGAGPRLFAGGEFLTAGGLPASRVAEWNGTAWSPLGAGVGGAGSPFVAALAALGSGPGAALFVGGSFGLAGGQSTANLARWTSAGWAPSSLGGVGAVGAVAALRTLDVLGVGPRVYAGGGFTSIGGTPAARVAAFDGAVWSPLGSGVSTGNVATLEAFDAGSGDELVVGGTFAVAGGPFSGRVARFDGATWSALGAGVSCVGCAGSQASALAASPGGTPTLAIGGQFDHADGAPAPFVTFFDGSGYASPGGATSTSGPVLALETFDDGGGADLYAGGSFGAAGAVTASRVARFDGATWTAVGSGLDGTVSALKTYDLGAGALLYAGGNFANAGATAASRVAAWDGANWSPLGAGCGGTGANVLALHGFADASGQALYAAGSFTTAGGAAAANVAKWQGGAWTALGVGPTAVGGVVRALASFDDGAGFGARLYAGGDFGVKRWDGTAWTVVGGAGVNGVCRALAVHADGAGPALYAGGAFDVLAGAPGSTVKKLGVAAWTTVGLPLTGGTVPGVYALRSFDDGAGAKLFAGGPFTTAGLLQIGRVARLTGTNWGPVGIGVDLPLTSQKAVFAFAEFSDALGAGLYAGGDYAFVDGVPNSYVCRWGTAVGGQPVITTDLPPLTIVQEGQPIVLTCAAAGGQPLTYEWIKNGASVPGAVGPTLQVPYALYADEGVYTCYATNGCGSQNTVNAKVIVESATLMWSYAGLPFSAQYHLTAPGRPFTFYFVAISLNSNNGALPYQGPFGGLWLPLADVVLQFSTQQPPFVGVTDILGNASWSSYPFPLPLNQPYTLYATAYLFDHFTLQPLGRSPISSYPLH